MKKSFRHAAGAAFAAALAMVALTVSAAAADIAVRVDDQPVVFTDVQPLLKDDRTFVPFRAIFEQMGAAVSWDNDARAVVAERDGRTVRLTIGEAAVQVTENGDTRTLVTDAAAFIENGRTMVPVRFAAQALGACVDWENASRTVLIVDVDKLMDDYAGVYDTMDEYLAFAAPAQAQAVDGGFSLDLTWHTAMGDVPVGMTGTLAGAESRDAARLGGTVTTDVAALQKAVEQNEDKRVIDSEIEALLNKLKEQSFDMIVSRMDGVLYVQSALLTELGVPADGWAALPLDGLTGSAMSDMLTAAATGSFGDYIAARAQQTVLRDTPEATVDAVRAVLDDHAERYGDDSFIKSGDRVKLVETGGNSETTLTLRYDMDGKVAQAEMHSTASQDGAVCTIEAGQTGDAFEVSVSLTGGSRLDLAFALTLRMTEDASAPAVRPEGEIIRVTL